MLETKSSHSTDVVTGEVHNYEHLQRHLTPRQIQFVAIGDSIGTALFVSIGYGLMRGAASLLIAPTFHACVIPLVNNALAEMTVFVSISVSFIHHAGAWVDDAWGFMKSASKSVYWRFFIGGALRVGIVLPANDPTLISLLSSGETGTGAASPFVIAMNNTNIGIIPHIVNALLMTSIFSTGNAHVYCSS
ncbi:General amino acid permease AGP2 [Colletotrichum orbiculare MAFF 240422]|uniref:General amino acid permease AGP2 n=1 Tax=Colletotrichum orbiculare (strain 104-T / ATCC 96160 / CBS 514.97 / LARS 414 / MAFF 240422) TaxID=1213857 RepID=A0A484FSZ6_COLOR|nr:General amino acid permease AGP2 [Colletotrichum orbiculare MAFF 240422]